MPLLPHQLDTSSCHRCHRPPCLCLLILHLCRPLFLLSMSSFAAFHSLVHITSSPAADITWIAHLCWPLLQVCTTSITVSPSCRSTLTPHQPALAQVHALLETYDTAYRTIFWSFCLFWVKVCGLDTFSIASQAAAPLNACACCHIRQGQCDPYYCHREMENIQPHYLPLSHGWCTVHPWWR